MILRNGRPLLVGITSWTSGTGGSGVSPTCQSPTLTPTRDLATPSQTTQQIPPRSYIYCHSRTPTPLLPLSRRYPLSNNTTTTPALWGLQLLTHLYPPPPPLPPLPPSLTTAAEAPT